MLSLKHHRCFLRYFHIFSNGIFFKFFHLPSHRIEQLQLYHQIVGVGYYYDDFFQTLLGDGPLNSHLLTQMTVYRTDKIMLDDAVRVEME